MKIARIFFLYFLAVPAWGQSLSAGSIYLPPGTGLWTRELSAPATASLNPAAFMGKATADAVILTRRPYLIEGMHTVDAFARSVIQNNTAIGVSIHQLSYAGFRETGASLSMGRRLSEQWRIGAGFGLTRLSITGLRSIQGITGSLAIQRQIKGCTVGLVILSRQAPGKGGKSGSVRTGWLVGLGKDWSEQLYTDFNLHYHPDDGWQMTSVFCYQPVTSWRIGIRIMGHPLQYGFETGYQWKQYALRIFSDWHPRLGWSPGLLLAFSSFKNTKP